MQAVYTQDVTRLHSLIHEILYLAYGIKTNCCLHKLVFEVSVQGYRNTNNLFENCIGYLHYL
jgi:hypothetical protein